MKKLFTMKATALCMLLLMMMSAVFVACSNDDFESTERPMTLATRSMNNGGDPGTTENTPVYIKGDWIPVSISDDKMKIDGRIRFEDQQIRDYDGPIEDAESPMPHPIYNSCFIYSTNSENKFDASITGVDLSLKWGTPGESSVALDYTFTFHFTRRDSFFSERHAWENGVETIKYDTTTTVTNGKLEQKGTYPFNLKKQ